MVIEDWLVAILHEWNEIAILISLLVSILVALSGVLPSIFITSANVLFFGITNGLIISWLGDVIGSAIAFKLYRWGFKNQTEKLGAKYILLNNITNAEGIGTTILVFQARLIPYIPSGLVTLAGAVSNINMYHFMAATAIGKLPSIALEVFIAYQIIQLSSFWIGIFFLAIFAVTIIFMFNQKKQPQVEMGSGFGLSDSIDKERVKG